MPDIWLDGRLAAGRRPAPLGHRPRLPARRRRVRDAARAARASRSSCASTSPGCARALPRPGRSRCPTTRRRSPAAIADLLRGGRPRRRAAGDAAMRITASRGPVERPRPAAAGLDDASRPSRSRPGRSPRRRPSCWSGACGSIASRRAPRPGFTAGRVKSTSRADYVLRQARGDAGAAPTTRCS